MSESMEGEESSVFANRTAYLHCCKTLPERVNEFSAAHEIGGGQYGKNGSWFV